MSVKFRITLVTAVFLGCALAAVTIYTIRTQRAHLLAESVRKVELALSMLSEMAEPSLAQGDVWTLVVLADRAAAGQPERVCVADAQGEVVADSRHTLYGGSLAVIRAARKTGQRIIARRGGLWEGASPVRNTSRRLAGVVYVSFSTEPTDRAIADMTRGVGGFAVISVLLGVLVAYALGRYLSTSLGPLLSGIRMTAEGNFQVETPRTGMVELDEIGRSFDWMAGLVGKQVQDLAILNQLATSLPAAKTLREFGEVLRSACRSLVEGDAFLLSGDPGTGTLTMVSEEKAARVTQRHAAFIAANERRAVMIGRGAELPPGHPVAEDVRLASAIVAPLITPGRQTAGILVVGFDPEKRVSPGRQDEAAVLAVTNLAAPILAALERSLTQEKAVEALKGILLPDALPQPEGLEIFAHSEPADAPSGFGGDYYDVLPLDQGLWGIAIGDVTGHGLEAGRYTAMAKYVIRSFALEYRSPARTISQADKTLAAQMGELEFVTVFFAALDVSRKELAYCCAGHLPGLLCSPASGSFRELSVGGALIGYGLSTAFMEETVSLQAGDILLLVTDGIVEARHGSDQYGLERVKTLVAANAKRSLRNIARAITDDVRSFTEGLVRDDMTLLLVRVAGQPGQVRHQSG